MAASPKSARTRRFAWPGTLIDSQRTASTSLMTAASLDKLTDAEITDLLAHLRA